MFVNQGVTLQDLNNPSFALPYGIAGAIANGTYSDFTSGLNLGSLPAGQQAALRAQGTYRILNTPFVVRARPLNSGTHARAAPTRMSAQRWPPTPDWGVSPLIWRVSTLIWQPQSDFLFLTDGVAGFCTAFFPALLTFLACSEPFHQLM